MREKIIAYDDTGEIYPNPFFTENLDRINRSMNSFKSFTVQPYRLLKRLRAYLTTKSIGRDKPNGLTGEHRIRHTKKT